MTMVDRIAKARILCVGDVMLDRFVQGDVSRISPEAPVPVFRWTSERKMLGLGTSIGFGSWLGGDGND